jgi:hypothetical protein
LFIAIYPKLKIVRGAVWVFNMGAQYFFVEWMCEWSSSVVPHWKETSLIPSTSSLDIAVYMSSSP